MNYKTYIEAELFKEWSKSIFENATKHGWHDKSISKQQYLGLIMTEVAEAVEADRNNRRANTEMMAEIMKVQAESEYGLTPQWYDYWFMDYYREYVKGSIEEEFADVVIRILDMAYEIHGYKMRWRGYYPWGDVYHEDLTFIEQAWHYVKEVLNWGTMNISDSVSYIFDWADHLNIDLKQHIEWKMKYNEYRSYKHGGKKY